MPNPEISLFDQTEQPMNWIRAMTCGVVSASFMMGFVDVFYMTGVTPFSFELYIGSLLRGSIYGSHNWTIGLIANWGLGALFGLVYAFGFEVGFRRASGRGGVLLGLGHAIIAAVAFFPFFNTIHGEAGTNLYPDFGIFGSGLSAPTPILLLMGHLLFGASMGVFYGPVRAFRIRDRAYEPDETASEIAPAA
jgi:hypothetical protein